ncbi:hypothetical protein [Sandaracinus amylolyticus]|uniref:Uncharacterized protein n=1 Tax=Sandaracinus amylolyticus TaxID=927083 RepID=A0A0F6VZF5_9BACT|nr:hypothetical protein [Sandaracinus amylolyticus]AKF03396.1 hypothetical protein DB32_000545 [Sandaracinus amylolyticus]
MRGEVEQELAIRAFRAAQVGPLRRAFGGIRTNRVSRGEGALLGANRSEDRALYVAVQLLGTSAAVVPTTFGSTGAGRGSGLTEVLMADDDVADFVLLPGDELWAVQGTLDVATYVISEVTF